MNFECHLTYNVADSALIETFATEGWKFSAIDGDPILGAKPHCYLTCHHTDWVQMWSKMFNKVQHIREHGKEPLREKIELIVYDTKGRK